VNKIKLIIQQIEAAFDSNQLDFAEGLIELLHDEYHIRLLEIKALNDLAQLPNRPHPE